MTHLDEFGRKVLESYFGIDLARHDEFADALKPVELTGGSWLFHQGDPGDALYFLIRGRLQVWREGSGDRPAELLGEVVPGESVGEVGLLTHAPRTASTRAIRDSLLVRVDRTTFERLAERYPALVLQLAASVAQRLQSNTSAERRVRPELKTIAIVALDDAPDLLAVVDALVDDLAAPRDALALRLETLAALGAPAAPASSATDLQSSLKHWIGGLEDERRLLVFRARPADGVWLRFAVRQADLVVRVASADAAPELRSWERSLEVSADESWRGARHVLLVTHPVGRSEITGTAAWLEPRPGLAPLHLRHGHPGDQKRVVRILSGQGIGLVLGGGAARGFAHLGVFKAMAELRVPVDWVGGTSMGAIMAASIALDLPVHDTIAYARKAFVEGRPFNDYTLPIIALLRGRRMQTLSAEYFGSDIEDLPMPFFCVSSNLGSGEINLHERGPLWRATCASAALPGVMPPAVHLHQLAVDGAMLNNLPVDIMQDKLVREVIAVDLTSRRQTDVAFDEVPSPWAILRGRVLPFGRRYRLPGAATMILKATELGTRRRVMELAARADLLLQPPVHGFGMLQVNQFDQVVDAGYVYAREHVAAWLEKRKRR